MRRLRLASAGALALLLCVGSVARAEGTREDNILAGIDVRQKLGTELPLDATFVDEGGKTVQLGEYFGKRPVIIAPVYYECPMLCSLVLEGFVKALRPLGFRPGDEFDVVIVSFDPGETPAMAAERKQDFVRRYIRDPREANIHFLTGRESAIKALTDAVGFKYAYDAAIDQYAHPAAITVLTPQGHVSRYLYGVEFAPRDLKLAIVEASEGRVGTFVEQALLFCYHYDPETGKYGLVILNFVRAAGALTVLLMVGWIVLSLRRERRQANADSRAAATGATK